MNLLFFLKLIPNDLKKQYYESIVKNGEVNCELWNEIITYFEENFKQINDIEKSLKSVLNNFNTNEKSELLQIIKKNNENLFKKLSNTIFSFEDIITVESTMVKSSLDKFSKIDIIKATKAASPSVVYYLQNIFTEIDFHKEISHMGSIPIEDIINIQTLMVKTINDMIIEVSY